MITAVAFVPSTPMLVPTAAAGAAGELDDVRAASIDALRTALAGGPARLVLVGAGRETRELGSGTGSLRGFGVPVDVPLDPAVPDPEPLPLALTIGAWLLTQVGWPGDRVAVELDPGASSGELLALGTQLARADPSTPRADPVTAGSRPGGDDSATALLVVADGSAARTERAPAALHPDAAAFDAAVAAALRSGDPAALAALDGDLARAVSAGGWPAWQVAAAATRGTAYDARLVQDTAPYGVGYLVATWVHPG